jgi:hypothetical protein
LQERQELVREIFEEIIEDIAVFKSVSREAVFEVIESVN